MNPPFSVSRIASTSHFSLFPYVPGNVMTAVMSASARWRVSLNSSTFVLSVLTVLLCVYMKLQVLYLWHRASRSTNFVSKPAAASPLPLETVMRVLRLNGPGEPECPHVLLLRTPKSASSSLSALFGLRSQTCKGALFPSGSVLPAGVYTLSAEALLGVPQEKIDKYRQFVAHMEYTEALRDRLHAQQLFRVATLRAPLARLESFLAYEEARPHAALQPALEYLTYSDAARALLVRRSHLSRPALRALVGRVMADFDLLVVQELYDESLAVLMHALRWRAVDVLAPRINVMQRDTKTQRLARGRAARLQTADDAELFRWMLRADAVLYERAVDTLRLKFLALPASYREVPDVLKQLRHSMETACRINVSQKHFSKSDTKCIRDVRVKLLDLAAANQSSQRSE